MLAWLMRRAWVTQLCTFAYVVVWPEIIYEVDYDIEAEELAAAEKARDAHSPSGEDDEQQQQQQPPQPLSPATTTTTTTTTTTATAANMTTSTELPPSIASLETTAPATTTEHAAEMARLERIADKAHREATERAIAHARRVAPLSTAHPSLNDAHHLKGLTPHIILDAKKATGKEARYLSAIARRFRDEKVRRAWQLFCKYFDGRCAMERIALQEEIRRKEVWNLLNAMTEFLMCARHW